MRLLPLFFAFAIGTSVACAQIFPRANQPGETQTPDLQLQSVSTPPLIPSTTRYVVVPDNQGRLNFDSSLALKLQEALNRVFAAYAVTGMSAAVCIPGMGIWLGSRGYSTPSPPEPVRPEMLFNIGSNTKLFTSTLILQLVDEGKISLEDSLGKYLPPFPNILGSVTIRQLLNMTSGFYDYWNDNPATAKAMRTYPDRSWSPEEILSTFVGPPKQPPGGPWAYCNTNYLLAGMIIRNVTRSSLSQQYRSRIFIPLSLGHVFLPPEDSLPGPTAHPWYNAQDYTIYYRSANPSLASSAGALFSTAEDAARWADGLFRGNVISSASKTNLMTTIPIAGLATRIPELVYEEYGLGLIRYSLYGKLLWGHSGGNYGYESHIAYHPGTGVTVIVLTNDNHPTSGPIFVGTTSLYAPVLQRSNPWLFVNTGTVALGAIPQALARYDTSFLVTNQGVGVDSISLSLDSTLYADSSVIVSPSRFALPSGSSQKVAFSFNPQKLQLAKLFRTVVKVDSRFSAGPTHFEKTFTFGATTTTLYLNTARFEMWNLPRTPSRFDTTFLVTNYGAVSDSVYLSIDPVNTTPDSALSVSPRACGLPPGASVVVTFSIKPWLLSAGTTYNAAVILESRFGVGQTHFEKGVVFTLTDLLAVGPESSLPLTFRLEQNYPNPFNPTTNIAFSIPASRENGVGGIETKLVVYDLLGREVATLVDENKSAGVHTVQFDASGLASGVYLYRMVAGIYTCTRKMIVMK